VKRTESAVVLSRMAITPAARRFERSAKNQETVILRMTVMAETVRRLSEWPSCMGWMKSSEAQTLIHVNQLAPGTFATDRHLP